MSVGETPSEIPPSSPSMKDILRRLEASASSRLEPVAQGVLGMAQSIEDRLTGEFKYQTRTKKITDLINQPTGDQQLVTAVEAASQGKPKEQESAQDQLIAYLYAKVRAKFNQEGRVYNPEREDKQITAILHLLKGDHVHLPTGFGKSSLVLPITTIVHALTRGENPILTTVNNQLLKDLEGYINDFCTFLPEKIKPQLQLEEDEESPEDLSKSYGERFWHHALTTPESPPPFIAKDGQKTIFLTEDRHLVFRTMEDRQRWGKLPWVYFDEAHVPYDRKSPYVTTQEGELTEAGKADFRQQWLVTRVLSQSLGDSDFTKENGEYHLTDQAYDKLRLLSQSDGFAQKVDEQIDTISLKTGEDRNSIRKDFSDWWNKLGDEKGKVTEMLSTWLAQIKPYQLGSEYVYDDKDQLVVRDQYLGLYLKDHRFDPFVDLVLSARDNRFSYVPLIKASRSVINYSSFIALVLGGRLSVTSGTLLYPDLVSKSPTSSDFANFLNHCTEGHVVKVDWSAKNPPSPDFYPDNDSALAELTKRFQSAPAKPTLIVCWNEEEGKAIREKLLAQFPGQVRLISGETGEVEAKGIYQLMEKNDSSATFVVSTGKTGLGVDIKHPDLRVALFNMPLTQLQVWQALGRRRGEGEDFHWFITAPSLQKFIDVLDPEIPALKRIFGQKPEFEKISANLSGSDPKLKLSALNRLFNRFRTLAPADDELTITMDKFYFDRLKPKALALVRKDLIDWLKNHPLDEFSKRVFASFIPQGAQVTAENVALEFLENNLVGLPESLYWQGWWELPFIRDAANIGDLVETKMALKLLESLPADLGEWTTSRLSQSAEGNLKQIVDFIKEKVDPSKISRFFVGSYLGPQEGLREDQLTQHFSPFFPQEQAVGFGYVVDNLSSKKIAAFKKNDRVWLLGDNGRPFHFPIVLKEGETAADLLQTSPRTLFSLEQTT